MIEITICKNDRQSSICFYFHEKQDESGILLHFTCYKDDENSIAVSIAFQSSYCYSIELIACHQCGI